MRVEFLNWKKRDVKAPSINMPFTKLPWKNLEEFMDIAEEFRSRFDTMVVVGMGGSSLGTKTVYDALSFKADRELLFIDNIDPLLISKVLRSLNWEDSCFLFASKSGRTLETVTVLNIILRELKSRSFSLEDKIVFIGDEDNPFESLALRLNCRFISVPKEVGGRFSVFTSVSLVPLSFAGFDVEEFLLGADSVVSNKEIALNLALWKYENYLKGRKNSVLMPYTSFLYEFTEWYSQLWGESLGKEGKGQTPVRAVGTSSQHSVLQLFMDGPDDKVFQFFIVERFPLDYRLPKRTEILDYISGKKVSEVIKAEFEGTLQSLLSKGKPVVTFTLNRLKEREIGTLLMTYLIATVKMAELLGVNPYGQPAVEKGKLIAKEILSLTLPKE